MITNISESAMKLWATLPSDRQLIAEADNNTLLSWGVTQGQLAEKLQDLIQKVNALYASSGGTQTRFSRDGLIISYEGQLKSRESCPGCSAVISGRAMYRFEKRGDYFKCTTTSLHMLEQHGYCGLHSTADRIDPERVCQILGLGNRPSSDFDF